MAKGQKFSKSDVSIKMVEGSVLRGKITLETGKRVSDIFTQADNPFVVLCDVVGSQGTGSKVMIVNKNHIVWVEPEENAA
ncbi:MAG: hypothetical protein A2V87_05955 [Deltaproteobacteria bacterium RBG_16_58_17]|nr:MAG: hypothetical protein A2V87_05955 [Deltaproteobacteria bacterium RBG_16_58_17]OHE18653.1 MAG: hypothetical protein A2X96_06075 [Syntrophobacterales bacterium GWC2_56_13]OHE19365.1 MAG: hypothetical protein A2X95_08580 [Syntrophobacterales bacterium GWF2_56_9]